jgi:Chitobiase/beta-hexosaminidase C-terminal domain
MPDAQLFEFTLSKDSLSQMWLSGWSGMGSAPDTSNARQQAFHIYLDSIGSTQAWDSPTTAPALVVPFSMGSLIVPAPTASPSSGSITSSTPITLSCTLAATTIHYSYDGGDPLTSGLSVPNGGVITIPVNGNVTLAIQATALYMTPSTVVYETYGPASSMDFSHAYNSSYVGILSFL